MPVKPSEERLSRPDLKADLEAAAVLASWCAEVQTSHGDPFEAARLIARKLGGHGQSDGAATFGFWAPEVEERRVAQGDVMLEILSPAEPLMPATGRREVRFHRHMLPVVLQGPYVWAAVQGVTAGRRDRLGSLYRLTYQLPDGRWEHAGDVLAHSLPFGVAAPAELYDMASLHADRADKPYYEALAAEHGDREALYRFPPCANILQVHAGTGSAGGTLASLARLYESIAEKVRRGQPLQPFEEAYIHYDAVQLMPVEPTVVFESGPSFFQELEPDPQREDTFIAVQHPSTTNWGYDIVLSGMAAVNPAILETGRPDELVDLAAVLHTFPTGPIRLIFDLVYGHADNQAIDLISRHYFMGPNMYGQDVNLRHPVVRAILLEMQRRKGDFGADGVRVDGAQDFRWFNQDTQELLHDDDYLRAMSAVEQEVCGFRYLPWMIFEDGRPWPREDWELTSTYRTVIEDQGGADKAVPNPDVFQWGPLTFAHNTPFKVTFWASKWWRVQEIALVGQNWISGCANHDTLRRGSQVDPDKGVNRNLGETLLEILDTAYDHTASNMLFYGFLPGVPMDFINASLRASWGFIRNTDDHYGVKVVSEEAMFLDWQVNEAFYTRPGNFERLKDLGFTDLEELRRFMRVMVTAVDATGYDLPAMADMLNAVNPRLQGPEVFTEHALKIIAHAFMDDLHDYCNVSFYYNLLSPMQVAHNAFLRQFRHARPWLRGNLTGTDKIDRLKPADGAVIYYGHRTSPTTGEQVMLVANMEGLPRELSLFDLPLPHPIPRDGWKNVQTSPGLWIDDVTKPFTLYDGKALLLTRDA